VAFQFGTDFPEIVDLSVIDNDGFAIVRAERLVAIIQVENLQTHRAQRDSRRRVTALLIWPAVSQRGCHPAYNTVAKTSGMLGKPGYPAHRFFHP
jgi:hypothetical protein